MYCHVSRQCDDHAHGEHVADRFHDALNKRIAELTAEGAEFDPFDLENINEALGSLTLCQRLIQREAYKFYPEKVGILQTNWINQYWTLQAENKAIEEFSK
jgi:hypothetical protein